MNSLLKRLEFFLKQSGFEVIGIERQKSGLYKINIKKNINFSIYAFLRSVSKNGWGNKKEVRRVQVPGFNLNEIPSTDDHCTAMIIGLENLFGEDVMVCWDIYKYGFHHTNRSCYINAFNIYKGFSQEYHTCTDSDHKVWICSVNSFQKLLHEYIKYNKVQLGD